MSGFHSFSPGFLRPLRVAGIEPAFQAWEAHVLPLNHTRVGVGRELSLGISKLEFKAISTRSGRKKTRFLMKISLLRLLKSGDILVSAGIA